MHSMVASSSPSRGDKISTEGTVSVISSGLTSVLARESVETFSPAAVVVIVAVVLDSATLYNFQLKTYKV